MSINSENEGHLDFALIIDFLKVYRKPIAIISVTAGVLAFIFSMPYFIAPKYKSTVIIYPTRTSSISRSLIGQYSEQQDILKFGEEEESEILLQILESEEITEKVAKRFNLLKHYDIKPDADYPKTYLLSKFQKNVKYRRTEYMSIEIAVLDEDKQIAADMANHISILLDSVKTRLQQERALEALQIIKKRYEEKEYQVNKTIDSLKKIGELGVQNYQEQSAVITEQYARARMGNNAAVAAELKELEQRLAKYGPVHERLQKELQNNVNQLVELESKLAQAKIDAENSLSHRFVINKAIPAEKKAYPLRSLIILISMCSAFVCSVLVFAVINNYNYYKKKKELLEAKEKYFA